MIRQSDYLNIPHERMEELGVFDSFLDVDARMFLDPFLLKNIKVSEFTNSRAKIIKYYSAIITLLSSSNRKYDLAWVEAQKRLIFRELRGVSIGYGNSSGDGSGVGFKLGAKLISRAKEIIDMGIKDPEIFELIGLFEEDFGADRISDMAIRIIKDDIFSYTQRIAKELKIKKVTNIKVSGKGYTIPLDLSRRRPIFFLPKDLLSPLPVALSWEEIGHASQVNSEIRRQLNELITQIWAMKKAKKEDIRTLIFSKKDNIRSIIEGYKNIKAEPYDFDKDPSKEISWFYYGSKLAKENPLQLRLNSDPDFEEIIEVVEKIISQYKKLIESNGANIHLFTKNATTLKPAHERYAQNLFLCIADCYCKANDLDLSPEVNSGNGAIDFKISKGYKRRVLVEIKLSSNSHLVPGFQKQIEAYKESENTNKCYYVVIRVTSSASQLKTLETIRRLSSKDDIEASKLIIINGLLKASASKR